MPPPRTTRSPLARRRRARRRSRRRTPEPVVPSKGRIRRRRRRAGPSRRTPGRKNPEPRRGRPRSSSTWASPPRSPRRRRARRVRRRRPRETKRRRGRRGRRRRRRRRRKSPPRRSRGTLPRRRRPTPRRNPRTRPRRKPPTRAEYRCQRDDRKPRWRRAALRAGVRIRTRRIPRRRSRRRARRIPGRRIPARGRRLLRSRRILRRTPGKIRVNRTRVLSGARRPRRSPRPPRRRFWRRRRCGPSLASSTATATTSPASRRTPRARWWRRRVAQSAGAASVWFWDPLDDWKPLGNLPGATLTVVALQFANAKTAAQDMLLAASRDRHVCLYVPASVPAASETGGASGVWGESGWTLATRVKAHARRSPARRGACGAHTFAPRGGISAFGCGRWRTEGGHRREELGRLTSPTRWRSRLGESGGGSCCGRVKGTASGSSRGQDPHREGRGGRSPTRAPGTAPWPARVGEFLRRARRGGQALAWRPTVRFGGSRGGGGGVDGRADDDRRRRRWVSVRGVSRSRGSRARRAAGSPRSLSPARRRSALVAGMVLDTGGREATRRTSGGQAMTLAGCGADRAVRLFSVGGGGGGQRVERAEGGEPVREALSVRER